MMGHCLPIIVILFFFKTHFSTRSLMFLFSQPDDLCVFARISGLRCVLLTQFNGQDWRQSAKCNRVPTTYDCYIIDWEAKRYGMLIHSNFITFFLRQLSLSLCIMYSRTRNQCDSFCLGFDIVSIGGLLHWRS